MHNSSLLRRLILASMLVATLNACHPNEPSQNSGTGEATLKHSLDGILSKFALLDGPEGAPIPGNAVLRVETLEGQLLYEGAVGQAKYGSPDPMTTGHQFIISSTTKTLVATVVLQLWEEGLLGENGLDTTLQELGLFTDDILDKLVVYNGVSYGKNITVRQLLTHRSGIAEGIDNLGDFIAVFAESFQCSQTPNCDPSTLPDNKLWSRWDPLYPQDGRAGLVNSYISAQFQESQAIAAPGQKYYYSDTNYWMLGVVIQHVTDQPLYKVLRQRIFDPLKMDSTYTTYTQDPQEDRRQHALADFYVGGIPGVSSGANFSFDWAGGGVVTNAEELARFMRALMSGKLFKNDRTLKEMTTWHREPAIGEDATEYVGMGIFNTNISGLSLWGHTGFCYAFMFYDPETDLVYTGTFNRVTGDFFGPIHDIVLASHIKDA